MAFVGVRGVGEAEQVVLPWDVVHTEGVATARFATAALTIPVGRELAANDPLGIALGVPSVGDGLDGRQGFGAALPGSVLGVGTAAVGQTGVEGVGPVGRTVIVAVGAGTVGRAEVGTGIGTTVGFEFGSGGRTIGGFWTGDSDAFFVLALCFAFPLEAELSASPLAAGLFTCEDGLSPTPGV